MNEQDLMVIKERAKKATEGKWAWNRTGTELQCVEKGVAILKTKESVTLSGKAWIDSSEADEEFIANARQDVPFLIAEIERLRKGIDNACYHLATENISDEYVVGQIHKELIDLMKGEYPIK